MKAEYAAAVVLGGSAVLFGLLVDPPAKLIWNRSASAPQGLYWLGDAPLTKGHWAVLSARSGPAKWAAAREYIGEDWPLLKQISGLPGDTICREGTVVSINGQQAAQALLVDRMHRDLPVWEGCVTLAAGEVFLLSPHPSSLDGRYFGPVREADILGVAAPLFGSSVRGQSAEQGKAMQASAGVGKADPVGQVKSAGARHFLAPCLHNDFSAPIAPGRDAGFSASRHFYCRSGWRHVLIGESSHDG